MSRAPPILIEGRDSFSRRAFAWQIRIGSPAPPMLISYPGMNWLAWSLLSAVFAAATAVLAKIGVTGVNSHVATAVRTTVVLVFAWAVALTVAPLRSVLGFSARTWTFLALSGVATGLSWICYFRALQLGEASKVAPIDKLSVVFVLVFAALFLGEALTWKTALGAGLIAAGALVLAWP